MVGFQEVGNCPRASRERHAQTNASVVMLDVIKGAQEGGINSSVLSASLNEDASLRVGHSHNGK